jgi:hypothetical protein
MIYYAVVTVRSKAAMLRRQAAAFRTTAVMVRHTAASFRLAEAMVRQRSAASLARRIATTLCIGIAYP